MKNANQTTTTNSILFRCSYCKQPIEKEAKICHFCGRNQNRKINWINYLIRSTPLIMVIVALVQIFLAYHQFYEAKRERIEASEALAIADSAAINVIRLRNEAKLMVNELAIYLDSTKTEFQQKYEIVSTEVSKIKQRNLIISLRDDAIANGNRESFDRLMEMAKDSSDSIIQVAANSERLRVYTFYGGSLYFHYELVDTLSDGTIKRKYTTSELINILLNDENWARRVASARLLKSQGIEGVPEALMQCIRNDRNLHVVKYAILSFASISRCKVDDLFGFDEVEECWGKNSDMIIKK